MSTNLTKLISLLNEGEDIENPQLKPLFYAAIDELETIDEQTFSDLKYSFADVCFLTADSTIHSLLASKSNDPLYYFFKPNVNFDNPFADSNSVHIGISYDYPQSLPIFPRFYKELYPHIQVHIVNLAMVEQYPDLIKHFDGWINPGSADTFPRNLKEFSALDWNYEKRTSFEHLYQKVIDKVLEYNLPYFGICGGAQHLVLNQEGKLKPVKGFWDAYNMVEYKDFTLSAFLALTDAEAKEALLNCTMPKIHLITKTYNSYSAIALHLGDNIKLGATAAGDESIAMAYHREGGLQFATQYHIEELYHQDARQSQIFENFLELVELYHHAQEDGNYPDPQVLFPLIEARLEQCSISPTCEPIKNDFEPITTYQDFF